MFPVKGKKREKKGQERGVVRALRLSGDKKAVFSFENTAFFRCTLQCARVFDRLPFHAAYERCK